eukprot:750610-Prymnesium_polylepis.1
MVPLLRSLEPSERACEARFISQLQQLAVARVCVTRLTWGRCRVSSAQSRPRDDPGVPRPRGLRARGRQTALP